MHTPNTPEQDPQKQHGLSSTGYGARTPGYETSDVRVGGIVVFVASLVIFLVVFFVVCFFMGKVINTALIKHDGPPNKWNQFQYSPENPGKNLESNAVLEQQQLRAMTARFPTPRLQMDDGDQDVVDLHNREDLLLDHYSSSTDLPQGAVRIPIDRAMQLVVQRGLVEAPAAQAPQALMAGESAPAIQAPLTDGFARTGYELETIQARNEKNDFNRAEAKKDKARLAGHRKR